MSTASQETRIASQSAAPQSAAPQSAAPRSTAPQSAASIVEEALGTLFRQVRSSWKTAALAIDPELTPIGYKILASLVHGGPAASRSLGETLAIDKSVMSRQVRALEELGLASSHADPLDGRARILTATPDAIRRVMASRSHSQALLEERLQEWTPAELQLFAELVNRISVITADHNAADHHAAAQESALPDETQR